MGETKWMQTEERNLTVLMNNTISFKVYGVIGVSKTNQNNFRT